MVRVRRLFAAAVIGGTCLAPLGCDKFSSLTSTGTGNANEPQKPDAPAVAADIGPSLYPGVKMPVLPPPTVQPDPIVIHPAVVQYDLKVQLGAEVETGRIELIARPVTGPYDLKDPLIIRHPRDENLIYRRLRENDVVVRGETLVRLDEQNVAAQVASSEKIIEVSGRALKAGNEAHENYKKQGEIIERLYEERRGVTIVEVLQIKATVARLLESVIQTEQTKAKAEAEWLQAKTILQRYFLKSPVNGRITRILKSPGEVAKGGEPILEIQSTDRVRVDGKLPAEYASLIRSGTSAVIEPMVPLGPSPFANWHHREVAGVAVTAHPGRPLVVSAGLDATALVWDVTQTKQSIRLPHPAGVGVRAVACTGPQSKGHWATTGADDGKVRLWDLSNPDKLWDAAADKKPKEPVAILEDGHSVPVTAAAFSPDGRFLATAAGREVYVWSVADKKKLYAIPHEHRDAVTSVRFTPQATLVTASKDRTMRVWKLGENGAAPTDLSIDHRGGDVDVLGVSADGTRVLFDKDAGRIDVIGLADGRTVGTVVNPGGNTRFSGLALFSPDDRFILTAGGESDAKGELQLWDNPKVGHRASERRRLVTPGRANVTCAAFSADPQNPFVVVGTQNGGVHYWTPPSEQPRQWVGRVESVLPADARTVQVRVVMDNPTEMGADALQDRSTATIIINPDGPAPTTDRAATLPMKQPLGLVQPAGGVVGNSAVIQAGATAVAPGEPTLAPSPAASPVKASPPPSAPIAVPPAAGGAKPAAGNAPLPSIPPVPEK